MKIKSHFILFLLALTTLFSVISCEIFKQDDTQITETLNVVEEVSLIPGAENATITVNKDNQAFFSIEFGDIEPNDVIQNGTGEGWCIDWQTPIDSEGGTFSGLELYSTYLVEQWKPVNYLLNIKEDLKAEDPEINNFVIQLAIWSFRANPEFNIEEVALEDLPDRMVADDGQPNFSYEKVREIIEIVEAGYKDFAYSSGTKFAVIASTPPDVQTVFTVVN